MEKMLNLIFSITLCITLAACNNPTVNANDNSDNSSPHVTPATTVTATNTPTDSSESMETASDEYQFVVNIDNTVTITKYIGEGGDVKVPSEDDTPLLGTGFIEETPGKSIACFCGNL